MNQQQTFSTPKSLITLIIGGMLLLLLATGCGPNAGSVAQDAGRQPFPAEPSAVTPTPTSAAPTPTSAPPAPTSAAPAPTSAASPRAQVAGTSASVGRVRAEIPFPPGSLLKSPADPGVFRFTPEGTRQHIYDWPTFLALGFNPESIVTVQQDLLDNIPLAGELTRLVYDANGWHYWAVEGTLWRIREWDAALSDAAYQGIPATPVDGLLLNSLPVQLTIPDNVLLRDGDAFYLKKHGQIYRLSERQVYRAYGYADADVIEIPAGVMSWNNSENILTTFLQDEGLPYGRGTIYQMRAGKRQAISRLQLARMGYGKSDISLVPPRFLLDFPLATSLRVVDTGANIRQGPGTEYEVAGQAAGNASLLPVARNQDGTWFQILYQGRPAWIAASVTTFSGNPDTLPIETVRTPRPTAVVAAPTPTPTPTGTAPEPINCEEVPIRGFGKVWADHPEIQPYLGCPNTWRGGEQGTRAAVQHFEHGIIVWVEQDRINEGDPIYVFFYDDNSYQRFRDLGAADPTKVGQTEPGFQPVGDKFSKVYWEGTGARVKERLGRATTAAADSPGAFQGFSRGRMLWLGEIERIFVIYDYGYYDDAGNWVRVKLWSSYEDTF